MAKRKNIDKEYEAPEVIETTAVDAVEAIEMIEDEIIPEVATSGFVQLIPEEDEPDMEVTVTTANVNNDGSVEFTEETYIEPGRKAEIKESKFIDEVVNAVANKFEPRELRKADPEVVAKSLENQASAKTKKVHIADNPFSKKVKPEIYNVKHSKNEELMTDFDLMDNIGLL